MGSYNLVELFTGSSKYRRQQKLFSSNDYRGDLYSYLFTVWYLSWYEGTFISTNDCEGLVGDHLGSLLVIVNNSITSK